MDLQPSASPARAPDGAGSFMAARRRSIDELNLHPGQRVLDVGCGPVDEELGTLALGRLVGTAGQVRGVDYDARTVAQANALASDQGLAGQVTHHHANATALPWPEAYFDAARCLGLLQTLLDPGLALDEMIRVTRNGGHLVVVDIDWATLSIECDEHEIERRLVRYRVESALPNPYSGRRLRGQLAARGLQDLKMQVWPLWWTELALADHVLGWQALEADALASGVVSTDELDHWHASLARCDGRQAYCACVNAMVVTGRRP